MTIIVILAVMGIALLLAELVLPGGIVGIGGAICLLAAVVLTFVNYGAMAGAIALVAVIIFGLIVLALWIKNFHRLPFTRKLVLNQAIDDPTEEQRLESLLGKQGITLTQISPSGYTEIDGEKVDVMSESGNIDKDKPVKVVETRGPSVFVEEIPSAVQQSRIG